MDNFFTLVLIAVAAGAGFLVWRANRGGKAGGQSLPGHAAPVSTELVIENMQAGGVFAIRAFGAAMEDLDIKVLNRHLYREGRFEWIELEGETAAGTLWLEVEIDDEKMISVTLRKVDLSDIGLSREQLEQIDDDEAGGFSYEGVEYVYKESDAAVFYRNSNPNDGEKFYYWDFVEKGGELSIGVEKWEDGSFICSLSQAVRESQITVYSLSGDG